MKNSIKLKGRMKSYLQSSLYLGFLLMAVNVLIYFIDYRAGVVLSIFIVLYISIILYMMFYLILKKIHIEFLIFHKKNIIELK